MINHLSSNSTDWIQALTRRFEMQVQAAIQERGVAHVSLCGGSTPAEFYRALRKLSLPWDRIEWWIGDERWVPSDHEASNERMIRESLGKDLPGFDRQLHSWHPAPDAKIAAERYNQMLRDRLGEPPRMDIMLLGLGTDGHTASLFPGTEALNEMMQYAVVNEVPQMKSTRLTMTYPTLNGAREVWFLVVGENKAEMVERLQRQDPEIPSGLVAVRDIHLFWCR